MKTPSEQEKEIGYRIKDFYTNKHDYDYKAAAKEVESLKVVDLKIDSNGDISISLARPGLLIGRKGKNIDNLSKFLGKKIHVVEAFHWDHVLVPDDLSYIDDWIY